MSGNGYGDNDYSGNDYGANVNNGGGGGTDYGGGDYGVNGYGGNGGNGGISIAAVNRIRSGISPGNPDIARSISAGIGFVSDFLRDKYFDEYIGRGGSKIKFIAGREGSGKSHLLELMAADALDAGYKTVSFSAKNVWLHDIKELYFEILKSIDLMTCLEGCRDSVIRELGFSPEDIPRGQRFTDYLSSENLLDAINKREIRQTLANVFLKNPLMDNNFAYACSMLTGALLGYPVLEDPSRELLLRWLEGSKDAKLPALRKLGLSPSKITKQNARHMLRSLAQVVRVSGYKGLFIAIDDLDILVSDDSLEELHYTKARREDAYESIRQLIDDIDTLGGIFFAFAFRREALDDELRGFKSYQALWMRVQNEVSSDRFNRFADIIDLDRLARQEYGSPVIIEMSQKLADLIGRYDNDAKPIDGAAAAELIERDGLGGVALPRRVNALTLGRSR